MIDTLNFSYSYRVTSSILILPDKLSLRRSPNPPSLPTPSPHNPLMHRRLNTVIHLEIQLGQCVLLIGGGLFNITERRSVDNVAYDETFDGLVFWDGFACGCAVG